MHVLDNGRTTGIFWGATCRYKNEDLSTYRPGVLTLAAHDNQCNVFYLCLKEKRGWPKRMGGRRERLGLGQWL